MNKCKIKKYLFAFSGFSVFFIFFWFYPVLGFNAWLKTEEAPELSIEEVFLNIMGPNGNFINPTKILVLYLVPFVLVLSALFFTDNPAFLVKLKSRKNYVNKHISDVLLFSAVFVLLIEAINILCALFMFGADLIIRFKLIEYSAIDYITLVLFYFRVGIMLFIFGVITNKKLAAFMTMALYFIEFFGGYFFHALENLWTPNKDAVSVIYLLTGSMQLTDSVPVIIRGLIMNIALVIFAYYLFSKKDIIEKKGNR